MPTVTVPKLKLTPAGNPLGTKIKVEVAYDIKFSRLESNIAPGVPPLGVRFSELVDLFGVDPVAFNPSLHTVAVGTLPVVRQDAEQTLERRHTIIVSRASLDEDRSPIKVDDDELQCRVRVLVHGLPKDTTNVVSNQVVLKDEPPINK